LPELITEYIFGITPLGGKRKIARNGIAPFYDYGQFRRLRKAATVAEKEKADKEKAQTNSHYPKILKRGRLFTGAYKPPFLLPLPLNNRIRMDLSNIISIAGMPGLYKVIAQAKNGVVVESLIDKKRSTAFASQRISALSDISIYTTGEDMPLKEVFAKIYAAENGGAAIDTKAANDAALREYTDKVLPEYDKDRVHTSDLKKLYNWYNLLQKSGLLETKEEEENSDEKKVKTEKEKTPAVPKPKKDVAAKSMAKSNAPKVKAQGVRKTGSA
jgi:hypothetical protein